MNQPLPRRSGAWSALRASHHHAPGHHTPGHRNRGRRTLAAGCVAGLATLFAAAPVATQPAVAAPAAPTTLPAPAALPAPTAALTEVTDFGRNPTGLQMFLYVPNHVQRHPAVLVVAHYCTGSGPAMFTGTDYASLADRDGFVVIYPSAPRDGHCFDVSSPGALTHNGNSDPVGIVSMVRYVERHQHGDANRVFVTGISSGAMLTNVLLGDYPDVFKAGSAMSGVAFGCFATTDGSMWNSQCANGQISKSPQEWGNLVRGAFPGYRGPRPRMQLWHGTADTILFYPNFGEEVKEWTDVLHTTRAVTDSPRPTWTHTAYTDRSGRVEVDAYSVAGATHNVAFDEPGLDELAVEFFGLTGHCGHLAPGGARPDTDGVIHNQGAAPADNGVIHMPN